MSCAAQDLHQLWTDGLLRIANEWTSNVEIYGRRGMDMTSETLRIDEATVSQHHPAFPRNADEGNQFLQNQTLSPF